jgi:hypothetical protein
MRSMKQTSKQIPCPIANGQAGASITSGRIYQMQKALLEALQAATQPISGESASSEMITASVAEYNILLNCQAIIERALTDLGAAEDIH